MSKVGTTFDSGILEDFYIDDNGTYMQHFRQDISKLLDDNKRKRNDTSSWRKFDPKQEMHQILGLSVTDVMRITNEHGIDITGNNVDWKYVFKLIETHYPYMKTTTARL